MDDKNNNTGLIDIGIGERIDADGFASVERIDSEKFVTTYWIWAKQGGVWVKAPRFYLFRPISSIKTNGLFRRMLDVQDSTTESLLIRH